MKKLNLFAVVALFLAVSLSTVSIKAQSNDEVPTFEVGTQYNLFTVSGKTYHGANALFAYNFNKYLSADVSFGLTPRQNALSGVLTTGLFGAKLGMRADKFGVFVKAKPGFIRISSGSSQTFFATDLGGVLEVYHTNRIGYRFDVGNLLFKQSGGSFSGLQVGAGVMLRF